MNVSTMILICVLAFVLGMQGVELRRLRAYINKLDEAMGQQVTQIRSACEAMAEDVKRFSALVDTLSKSDELTRAELELVQERIAIMSEDKP